MTLFPAAIPGTVRGKAAEKDWDRTVAEALTTFRWAHMHVYRAAMKDGSYRTTTTEPGWPDRVAFRGPYIAGIELKGYDARGRATPFQPGQVEWLERFAAIPTGRAWVLRPTDNLRVILGWLRDPGNAPRRFGYEPPNIPTTRAGAATPL